MSLIYDAAINGPATHALVIGIGHYAHLPGGLGNPYPDHEGLGQLTSPPHSARTFTTWLLEGYHNPNKPLGSVELLISEPGDSTLQLPGGAEVPIETAAFSHTESAILQWFERGNSNPDNLLIFYFCGHGVSKGYATSLLLEDFGANPFNPLNTALSFRDFYEGMDLCAARQQCYFIDACRTASPTLITRYNNYTGQPVMPGSAALSPVDGRMAPIFYATMPGIASYGIPNQPSVFTHALIKALMGAGSNEDEAEGDWRVDTDTLNRGIDHLIRRAVGSSPGLGQAISVDELVNFTLHYLQNDPIVPVTVGCQPSDANLAATLGYFRQEAPNPVLREDIAETPWQLELELGDYHFFADFPNHDYNPGDQDRRVSPPFRKIVLAVSA